MTHSQGLSNNIFLTRGNPIFNIDTSFFKIYSHMVFSHPRSLFLVDYQLKFRNTSIFPHFGYIPCLRQYSVFNYPDFIDQRYKL